MKMESVSLPREVITGRSKAADYVNFTGHGLLGQAPLSSPFTPLSLFFFFFKSLSVTPSLSVTSPEKSQVSMYIKSRDEQHSQTFFLSFFGECRFLFALPFGHLAHLFYSTFKRPTGLAAVSPSGFSQGRRGRMATGTGTDPVSWLFIKMTLQAPMRSDSEGGGPATAAATFRTKAAGRILIFPRFCSNCLHVNDCEMCSVNHRNFSRSVK